MTTSETRRNYEIDRLDESQAIVVKHTEDHSSGLPLLMGFLTYMVILPALGAIVLMPSLF